MRAVVQRVSRAEVKIAGKIAGEIGPGLLVFLGIAEGDSTGDGEWLAEKIVRLRVFSDAAAQMNLSVEQTGGGILVTIYSDETGGSKVGTITRSNYAAPPASMFR